MGVKYSSKAIILLIISAVFFMSQQTPAQKKRSKGTKAPPADASTAVPEISYTVSMTKPSTHLLEVEMRVKWGGMPPRIELKMPVWTPGSYLIRE